MVLTEAIIFQFPDAHAIIIILYIALAEHELEGSERYHQLVVFVLMHERSEPEGKIKSGIFWPSYHLNPLHNTNSSQ
jgi:hypothetical protein